MKKVISMFKGLMRVLKEKEIVPITIPTNMTQLLDGKIALITGGGGGIGFEIAKSYIDCGCKVILAGRNKEKLECAVSKLGEKSAYIIWDVQEVESIDRKILEAIELFDEKKIDILVNAAGVISEQDFWNMSEKEYDYVMDINTKGTYFMSQGVSKYMIKNNIKGHILNVSSASALRPAWSPYHLSKWAIKGMTVGLADILLPYGIIVNAIAPGPVATQMLNKKEGDTLYNASNPSGRFAVPSEVASLATFMVSDMGNLVIGDTFYITGGSGIISLHK